MNTRLQVEHRGDRGGHRARPRLVCRSSAPGASRSSGPRTTSTSTCHAIEVRLYAEDPAQDWLPSTGRITRFSPADVDDEDEYVVIDTGVSLLDDRPVDHEVTAHFDPLLAKFIARGYDRPTAIGRLVRYLTRLELHGVTTNRDYLLAVLQHPDFVEGRTTTALRRRPPGAARRRSRPGDGRPARPGRRAGAPMPRRPVPSPWAFAPIGLAQRRHALERTTFRHRERTVEVVHAPRPTARARPTSTASTSPGGIVEHDRIHLLLELDGATRCYRVRQVDDTWYVNSTLGQTDLVELPRFPSRPPPRLAGGPTAPVPGRVVTRRGRRSATTRRARPGARRARGHEGRTPRPRRPRPLGRRGARRSR